MARHVDRLIRSQGNTPQGRSASQTFASRGGHQNSLSALRQLQQNVNLALDPERTPEQRRISAQAVNRDVAILAEIGRSLENFRQVPSVNDGNLPVVNTGFLDAGIIGMTGHFSNMTERVTAD